MALDLMYNAMDTLLLNSTQWNYTAHNRNDLKVGDCWNQEDLSIYSVDQRDDKDDINSGGRAMEGFVRPYPHFVQGTPTKSTFDRKKGVYTLRYRADVDIDAPTVIFVPRLQFPDGCNVKVTGGGGATVVENGEGQLVTIVAKQSGEVEISIRRRHD